MSFLLRRCLYVLPKLEVRSLVKQSNCVTSVLRMNSIQLYTTTAPKDKEKVKISFKLPDEVVDCKANLDDTLLDVVINSDVPVDGFGACEGTLACSTCHVVLSQKDYDSLPDKPSDEELDMLDLAYGLTDTSRLGCQIVVTKDLEGLQVEVPETAFDAREA